MNRVGSLSTHILDTADGRPAAGVRYSLHRLDDKRMLVCTGITNDQGRTDVPLLSEGDFLVGAYELTFAVGEYFGKDTADAPDTRFLDEIVIRFRLGADEHYHVPLLVSPWSYTTYRGS